MAEHRILIYPCLHYMQTEETEQTVRKILFGKKMKLFPGGWTYLDQKRFRNTATPSANVKTAQKAVERGITFMRDAQKRWEEAGQRTHLFPVGSGLKLVKREVVQITAGKRKIGWRVAWNVLAQPGRESEFTPTSVKGFLLIENAEIVLYITQAGKVMGGNAHWRPTANPRSVVQMVFPDKFLEHVNAARKKGRRETGHEVESKQHSTKSRVSMHYSVGTRTEFRNFIDPYVRFLDSAQHSPKPTLIVPVTKYGVHAEILTRARRVGRVSSGTAEVEIIPWVNMYDGAKSVSPAQDGITGHWTLLSLDDNPSKAPRRVSLAEPLRLKGLYEVALTIQTAQGGIAHAHLDVCSALSPESVSDPESLVS